MDCLVALPTAQLENVTAHATLRPLSSDASLWGPVVDGVQLLGKPAQLAQDGKIASLVPTLLGSNHDEGTIFLPCQHSGANACTETMVSLTARRVTRVAHLRGLTDVA